MQSVKNNLIVTQSFGRESEYRRVILAILSVFVYVKPTDIKVVLYTDKPIFFEKWFKGLEVEFVLLTPEKVKEMRGEIDFLHRMKIALIEETFVSHPNANIFYVDSDTFFNDTPLPILNAVNENKAFMHLIEYEFAYLKDLPLPAGETFQAFYKYINSTTFTLNDGTSVKINNDNHSWNAGIMCFHSAHVRFIKDVYLLTDKFYPATLNHASEQYAFSIMLEKFTELQSCETVVYHYWYRIKKQVIDLLLAESDFITLENTDISHKISSLKPFLQKLPFYLDNHYLSLLDNAVQAFNEDNLAKGYSFYFKALSKKPFIVLNQWRDVLYHTKRLLFK